MLEADGWYFIRATGNHHHFRHPDRPGLVTVPHPKADLTVGTLKSIERQSSMKLRQAWPINNHAYIYTLIGKQEMATVSYTAIVERGRTGFGVFFPDVPGCVSAGRTEPEVFTNAEEALSGHLSEMVRAGESLPKRSDDIPSDPEVDEYCRLMVRVELPGKAVRLNITMDEGLVAAIDRVASNRSSFLAEAARSALATRNDRMRA